jgi:2-polyprenyl-3-methyl-5-hydroxy-6-metoxy-1,4-benzoquinol methylase
MSKMDIECIFCGKISDRIAWEENGYTGKQCECGLLYVSPRPSLSEMIAWYNSKEANMRGGSRIRSEFSNRLNSRHRLKLLKKYRRNGRLLEIGPGGGFFLDESRRAGFEPFGVELNLHQAKFIEEQLRIPIETNPFTESSFTGIHFDVICHFDVVSHFYDPISEFKKFNKRLKEGGILFFETGNGGDLSKRWLKFIGRLQYPQHLFLFSQKNIEQLCSQTGFEIIKIFQYSIFFQLFIIKVIQWLKGEEIRPTVKKDGNVSNGNLQQIFQKHKWWEGLFLKSIITLNFLIRYKIGRILPRFGPQTIIYVAKKVTTN